MKGLRFRRCLDGDISDSDVRISDREDSLVIAAAYHQGGFILGFYCPRTRTCVIPWGCKSHVKEDYYILENVNCELFWKQARNGNVPLGALDAGTSERGEPMYVGRCVVNGKLLCGKIHRSHGVCYVPDIGREFNSKVYDVLCVSVHENEQHHPKIPRDLPSKPRPLTDMSSFGINAVPASRIILPRSGGVQSNKQSSIKLTSRLRKKVSKPEWTRSQSSHRLKRLRP